MGPREVTGTPLWKVRRLICQRRRRLFNHRPAPQQPQRLPRLPRPTRISPISLTTKTCPLIYKCHPWKGRHGSDIEEYILYIYTCCRFTCKLSYSECSVTHPNCIQFFIGKSTLHACNWNRESIRARIFLGQFVARRMTTSYETTCRHDVINTVR